MERDDDVPVILLDDGVPGTATTRTVEIRPPRRRRELLLAVAAIAVVATVGLLGDGGGDTATEPTTSTTERTTTTRRTTSSNPARSTTTTSWPQRVAGAGPLLTSPSGTVVMLVDGGNRVTVIDLDTGDQCTTDPPGDGAWPALARPLRDIGVFDSGGGLLTIDRSCVVADLRRHSAGSAVAATGDSLWFHDEGTGELVERAVATGQATGRSFSFSPFHWPQIVGAGDRLVAGLAGDLTLLDPDRGTVTGLGTGTPIAGDGDRVAVVQCPRLRCALAIVDLATGDRREIPRVSPLPWETGAFSPDGRFLRVHAPARDADHHHIPAIVDLATGEVTTYERLDGLEFAFEGGWLIGAEDGDLVAFRRDGETVRFESIRSEGMILTFRRG